MIAQKVVLCLRCLLRRRWSIYLAELKQTNKSLLNFANKHLKDS